METKELFHNIIVLIVLIMNGKKAGTQACYKSFWPKSIDRCTQNVTDLVQCSISMVAKGLAEFMM